MLRTPARALALASVRLVFTVAVAALSAGCVSPLSTADSTPVTELWQISSFSGHVAQVKIVVGAGAGLMDSDGPPDWQENSWSCIDPLVISGNTSDGVNYASFNFSFDTKGTCSVLYAAQGQTLSGEANAPSLRNATQASGTLYFSYQDRHTPSYSQAGNYAWSAVRIQ